MTKPTLVSLIAVLATACGAEVPPECTGTLLPTRATDCATAAARLELAREVLDTRGLVPAAAFTEEFGWFGVVVRPEAWWIKGDLMIDGTFDAISGLETDGDMLSLVHELLHAHGTKRLQPGTAAHLHWDTNGFHAAWLDYRGRVEALLRSPPPAADAGAEPEVTCEGVECGAGEKCEVHEVRCIRAPCPPVAVCVASEQ